ncbi:Tho complex subunit 7-domain-containing protein, partial [Vararia minispora EC-137]
DAIILSRITNDERALRRIVKKFNTFAALAFPSSSFLPSSSIVPISVDDARDAFLVELASFNLQLKKAAMVCEAETRQVEEYQRERQRIEEERVALRRHIEQLKTSLEDAQVERRQKIEYDVFAEKINSLPSRAELEATIQHLENDMTAIRTDYDVQKRALNEQRSAFKSVVANLGLLQLTGRVPVEASRSGTPVAGAGDQDVPPSSPLPPLDDEREEGEEGESSDDAPLSATLNPHVPSPTPTRPEADDDIEMGELTEPRPSPRDGRGKKRAEDLEEGEASDVSSDLTDLPEE